jgi:hypothetical protein
VGLRKYHANLERCGNEAKENTKRDIISLRIKNMKVDIASKKNTKDDMSEDESCT